MIEEAVSSAPTFWALINSWFTPSFFFVLLQLVIGAIYIISNQKQQGADHQHTQPQQLLRSPTELQKRKSINFHSYTLRFQELPLQGQNAPESHSQINGSPSVLQSPINKLHNHFPTDPVVDFSSNFTTDTSLFQPTHESEKHHLDHDDELDADEPEKQQLDHTSVVETDEEKVGNGVWQIQHEEPDPSLDEIYSQLKNRTPLDTIHRKVKKSASTKWPFSHFKEEEAKVSAAVDDWVDAKADDFINKFKQQLKLQRLDSITRYKDMG